MLMPTAEVEVPTDLVRRLLAGQHLLRVIAAGGVRRRGIPAGEVGRPGGRGRLARAGCSRVVRDW